MIRSKLNVVATDATPSSTYVGRIFMFPSHTFMATPSALGVTNLSFVA